MVFDQGVVPGELRGAVGADAVGDAAGGVPPEDAGSGLVEVPGAEGLGPVGFAAEGSEVAGPGLRGAGGVGGVELIGVVEVLGAGGSAAEGEDLVAVAGDDDIADAFGDLVGGDSGVGVAADDASQGDAAVPEKMPQLANVDGSESFGAGDAILNVFFYLDQRRTVLLLCIEFVVLNVVLTGLTLAFGAALYGYGFALATLITLSTGLALLTRSLNQLEYRTFMLQ